jgi:hypothetical protein
MNEWMPHGFCFLWQGPILIPTIVTNAAIALSYLSISISLWSVRAYIRQPVELLVRSEPRLLNYALGSFAMFILWCGLTHLMDIVVIYQPYYGVQVFFLAMTAIFSTTTAYWLARFATAINLARLRKAAQA